MTPEEVLRALEGVLDPELDEPITGLGFVRAIEISGDGVKVSLAPPTYWCSPPFMYMIAEDVRRRLERLFRRVEIVLEDHHDGDRINSCLSRGLSLEQCYPEESGGLYGDLRRRMAIRILLNRFHKISEVLSRYCGEEAPLPRSSEILLGKICGVEAGPEDLAEVEGFVELARRAGISDEDLAGILRGLQNIRGGASAVARATATGIGASAELCRLLAANRSRAGDPR